MVAEAMAMAMTVWYIPGWLRTQEPRPEVMACVSNAFPGASISYRGWDGDSLVWSHAMASADKEAWRFAFELATMPREEREEVVLVGHSLGGRIVARVLARLAERGLKVRQGALLAAAIPSEDADLRKMGGGSTMPALAICNPDDVTLRYVYAIAGGEKSVAFGANGTLEPIPNVQERVTPSDITRQVRLEADWARIQPLKDIANHHEAFYFDYLRRVLGGEKPSGEVMVPQGLPSVAWTVGESDLLWETVETEAGWKLERNRITGHARIVDAERRRRAWGTLADMRPAFAKVRGQLKSAGKEK